VKYHENPKSPIPSTSCKALSRLRFENYFKGGISDALTWKSPFKCNALFIEILFKQYVVDGCGRTRGSHLDTSVIAFL
jgi:hypothetical protein